MTVKYKTVITKAGAIKLAAATVPNGKKVNFTAMAIGDGGGTLPVPDANQTKLVNEVWRYKLNKISQDNKHQNYVVAELLIPPETGGFWMREMGLYDDTGTMIAVGNMAESYKPKLEEGSGRAQTVRMVIMVSDIESVELTIDTSTVMATQDYVDDKLAEHEQSRRHPDATLTAKGFTQLSSATDSASEALAATPKAVKAAYDLANGKYTAQDATTAQKGIAQLSSATDSTSETLAATPKAVKIAMENASARLAKERNGADIPDKSLFVQNIGLGNVLFKGDGRFLAGTFVSDAVDRVSIGARAATGCQFMRAHQSPDAPDQVSFWQIITLTEVASPASVVDVLAISGNNVLFGHGTGAGITSWRNVAMLEGAAFTGDISAPNMRCDTTVTVGDGTGGIVKGGVDGAGFNGNNLNIKSWNGIGFQCSSDDVIRAYISTKLGIIAASESVYAGSANLYKNGDVYGDKWSTGNGANWLSLYLEQLDSQIRNNLTSWTSNNFPTKADVSVALSGKPGRQYIKEVGVYQNDKTKPFMLHDDNSGIFLATMSSVHLDANGWHRDASTGLITQWGSGNVAGNQQQRVNFPMAFPNTCTTVIASDTGSGSIALSTMSKDNGGFTVRGASSTFGFNWFAMGY
ncbi:phage tail protein [Salmonella enterica subsp. enterica serovar Muenster]|uniref:Phage tail protein n=6 Tax=Salmonella enterica TaxID=28901 RepID=A0A736HKK0_SALET|nr:phage tail protein [Salmonella enterica subsp. enterica serovar Agona]EAA7280690.1 phage tail protein [Salmonella enterica]EAM7838923.1 phage tail protein [Salmonella enterica subsp. enterica]EAP7336847.1 phage tail protein [Salmonella enterica subsp. enterica serovar Orion]EBM0680714.1 phage tail protein [Salmonella enterica subsp. enterica serovar Enteritidis]EBO2413815.1 phage tail protein [Salmonella enterica subsp. enterica serovar Schwarzengrund]EBO2429462.1 phage tail protein [Salmo